MGAQPLQNMNYLGRGYAPLLALTFPVKYVLQGASPEKGRATLTNRAKELEYQ